MRTRLRWQYLLFIAALAILGISLLIRILLQPQPNPEPNDVEVGGVSPTPTTELIEVEPIVLTDVPETVATSQSEPSPNLQPITNVEASRVTFREALIGQVQRLNPLFVGVNPTDDAITSLIYEGLTKLNEYGEPIPALAERWIVSNDGLEYVFILRQDILWQDGTSFSADDVIYTVSILSSPDFPGNPELGTFWRTVETQKLENHIVRFRLVQPLGSFLNNLTIGILPAHPLLGIEAQQLANHPFNLSPIGTGAYQLEALRSSDGNQIDIVDLQLAPTYLERPSNTETLTSERIRFQLYDSFDEAARALQLSEVDGLAARDRFERVALSNIPNINIYTTIDPTLGILVFNWDEGDEDRFFGDRRVRIALQAGLNPGGIIERHLSNAAIVADSPLIPGSWAYRSNLPWQPYNPEATINTLTSLRGLQPNEQQEEASPSEPLRRFSILVPTDPALEGIASEIAGQWSVYNIEVVIEAVDAETYASRIDNGDFEAAIVELPMGSNPDAYAYWHQGQYPNGLNFGSVSDDRLSEVLEQARRTENGINRAQLFERFQQVFAERGIAIPLYYPLFTYAVRNNISGIQLGFIGSPIDRFRTIANWQVIN